MLKILVRIAIPVCVLFLAFFRFSNNLYNALIIALLIILAILYYMMEDVVTKGMIKKATGEECFSFAAGYIKKANDTTFTKGRVAVTPNEIRFYKRAKDIGGCQLLYSCFTSEVKSYTIGKVDEFHNGVSFILNSDETVLFSSSAIAKQESALKKALGWS